MSDQSKCGQIGSRISVLAISIFLLFSIVSIETATPKTNDDYVMSQPIIVSPNLGDVWAGIHLIIWDGEKDLEDGWNVYCDFNGIEPYDYTLATYLYASEFPPGGYWEFEWDTTIVPDGYWHIVIIEIGVFSIGALPGVSNLFEVDNGGGDSPPVSEATGPTKITTNTNVTIWSNASDDNGLTNISLYVSVNGGNFVLAPTIGNNPVSVSGTSVSVNWIYTPNSNGTHDFYSLAYDNIGQCEANVGYDFRMNSLGKKSTTENITIMDAKLASGLVYSAAVWTGEYVFIFGGYDGSVRHSEIQRYDPSTDQICIMAATLPYGLAQAPAVWTGEYAYIFGGWKGDTSSAIHRYDPVSDTLTTVGALPSARTEASAVWTGEYAYIFGGFASNYLDEIVRFDPVTNATTVMSSHLPTLRTRTSAVWSGTCAYIFGGGANPGGTVAEIVCYDPFNNIVSIESSVLPSARYRTSAIFDGRMAYIFGGSYDLYDQYFDEIVQFDPNNGNVTIMVDKLPDKRMGTAAVWADSAAYIIGGQNLTYACLDEIVQYTPISIHEFDLPLRLGWNLISLPLVQCDDSLDEVLYSINGKWDYILAYNASDTDHWKTNATFRLDQLDDLKALDHKVGFWINITEPNVIITVRGQMPISTTISLHTGWNLVGYPTVNDTITVANALWGTGATIVEVFDPTTTYHTRVVGPTYIMNPGKGYWVYVPADSIWTVNW